MPAPIHARADIVAAIVTALTGLPTTGNRVDRGRTRPLAAKHRPLLLVYARSEQSDSDAMGGILLRDLRIRIEGRVITADVPDGTLDQIALEVEPAMVADPSLGGRVKEITLIATTINAQAAGDEHAGEITLDYRVLYRTHEHAPATPV
jgi:hypothetical protein